MYASGCFIRKFWSIKHSYDRSRISSHFVAGSKHATYFQLLIHQRDLIIGWSTILKNILNLYYGSRRVYLRVENQR